MIKIVANFDELYDGQFSGSWDDLTDVPDTLIGSFGITDGSNNQVLTTDGNGNLTFANAAVSFTTSDVDAHLNVSGAANNQILSWNGTDYAWINDSVGSGSGGLSNTEIINLVTGSDLDMGTNKILFSNVYSTANSLPDAGDYHGMFAHVHDTGKAYYAHGGAWIRLANFDEVGGGGSGGLSSRASKSTTASSLANNGTANIIIDGFKGYALYSIQTSHAAWVRLYINASSRTADASRSQTSDPAPDAGVIAEVITAGAETVKFGPAILGYTDDAGTSITAAVTNLSGATNNVTVTLNILKLEE
jgi:hypothetical protein